jgi:hypothetical protein
MLAKYFLDMYKHIQEDRQLASNHAVLCDRKSSIILIGWQTNIDIKRSLKKGKERTDLVPSSISPPLLWTEWRRLRRNVNLRRKRGAGSSEELDKSIDGCCILDGDNGFDINDDGDTSVNLSKNVLFRFDDLRLDGGVCTGDVRFGKVILGGEGDGISIGFVEFWIIRIGGIGIFAVVAAVVVVDDDEGSSDDEAKYTVSVDIKEG